MCSCDWSLPVNRTTLMLPAELKARASQRARELGISLGELVRQAIADYLESAGPEGETDALLGDVAVCDGEAPADLAANHDRCLYEDR